MKLHPLGSSVEVKSDSEKCEINLFDNCKDFLGISISTASQHIQVRKLNMARFPHLKQRIAVFVFESKEQCDKHIFGHLWHDSEIIFESESNA